MVYPNPQIYHPLKTIFVHVPKTAGTSIERTLLQGANTVVGGHTTAVGYRNKYPEAFASYFKFSILRDPVDRFVSAYCYLKGRTLLNALNNERVHQCDSLGDFVRMIDREPEILNQIVHLIPQHRFVCDAQGQVLVDQICYFEDLPAAWELLSGKIGIPHVPLGKMNVSRRPADICLTDPALVAAIRRHYARDYDLFHFSRS